LIAKGLISNLDGDILPGIGTSFNDGLPTDVFFKTGAGSRVGIADRVINTADTGYLARKLVYFLNGIELHPSLRDCKTDRTINLQISDTNMLKKLKYRFILQNGNIVPIEEAGIKVGDTINLRSPIYCKSDKICHICHGTSYVRKPTPYIGAMYALLLGECATQASMKKFHTGGAIEIKKKNIIQDLLSNAPVLTRNFLTTYITSGDNLISCKKDCKLVVDVVDLDMSEDGDYYYNDETKRIIFKSMVATLEIEDVKIPMMLDYIVDMDIVNLIEQDKERIIFSFDAGSNILYTSIEDNSMTALSRYLDRLIGGRIKFYNTEHLLSIIYQQYKSISNLPIVSFEILLSQILRYKKDPRYAARLGKTWDPVLMNLKKSVYNEGFIQGLAFENINEAIRNGLVQDTGTDLTVLEKVFTGEQKMISFKNAKLYKIYDSFRFYNKPKTPFMITYLSENSSFLKDYSRLGLQRVDFKTVSLPITKLPRTYPTSDDRKLFKKIGYRLNGRDKYVAGKNFIFDPSKYLYLLDQIYKPNTYRQKYGRMIMNIVNDSFTKIPSNYEKILMYSIKIDDNFNTNYINRKIFLFLESMQENTFPFDHFILCLTSNDKTYYRILIKDREFHFNRIKQYIKNVREIDIEDEIEIEDEKNKLVKNIISKIDDKIDDKNKELYSDIVKDFIDEHPEESNKLVDNKSNLTTDDALDLVSIAILVKNNNSVYKSKTMVKGNNADSESRFKYIEKRFVDEIIISKKANVDNDNVLYEKVKISEAVDNISPTHIYEKRTRDFSENLSKDIKLLFKSLETKDVPLTLTSINFDNSYKQDWNLNRSDLTYLHIVLTDDKNKKHQIKIQVPKINKDGTFFLNGKRKCIINQIIQLPIQFPKPFSAKFESSYSMFHIYSKHAKTNHLQIFMGTYKISLAALMFYGFGFEKSLHRFDIKYSIQNEKPAKDVKYTIQLGKRYYIFKNIDSELKIQFINSFLREDWSSIPIEVNENSDGLTKKFFTKFLIKNTGRVNSVYLIQNNLDNIVDNISQGILASKGLPVRLIDILHYMSKYAVEGYTIQRTDLDNQRIRSSEIISHLLQKQIMTAHTIYKEKYLAGNEDAIFEMPETKLISEFGMAEIVTNMEYANPIEELSVMTRISPIGKQIGGVPDKGMVTLANRGLHQSYYGNIDPVDTPEGAGVGVTQQLTMGVAISTTRGLFADNGKDVEKKPSMAVSPTTAMIPFVNTNDGNRVMFACSQMKQVVPLQNPEPPVVQTGYESILTNDLSENFIKRSSCNGKIEKITKDEIIIRCDKTKKKSSILIHPIHLESGSGTNTLSEFHTVVKEGQRVKENQRLAEGGSIKNGFLSMGRNLCAAFMGYKGYNFEDGIVINERLVKENKLTSLHGVIETMRIDPKDKILFIAKIGDQTNHGDLLIKKSIGELDELLGLTDEDDDDVLLEFENGQMLQKSSGGKIVDIEVYCNDNISKHPEYVQQLIKKTNKKRNNPSQKYKDKNGSIKGTFIKIILNQELGVTIGDKLTNRYGGKGIVSLIEKEEYMPVTPWGDKVDIILSPIGILNRMNTGQLLEMNVALISKILAINILKNKNSRSKVVSLVKNVLNWLDKTDKKYIVSSITANLNTMNASRYSMFIKELEAHTFFPIIIPPYKTPKTSDIHAVYKFLKIPQAYHLMLPEYGIKTLDEVSVGYVYYQKLEHMAKLKLHSRSTGSVISKTGQPTAGKRRGGGIRVGEADIYALVSHNATNISNELFGAMSDGTQAKNEEISNILMNGHTEYVHSEDSQVAELLRCYFIAMMLQKG